MSEIAIIGSAHVVIRALTDRVEGDIERSLAPAAKKAGDRAGRQLSKSISQSVNRDGVSIEKINSKGVDVAVERWRKSTQNKMKISPSVDTRGVNRSLSGIYRDAERAGRLSNLSFIRGFGTPDISPVMKRMIAQIVLLTPVIGAVVAGLSSLVSGLFAVGSAASVAVNSLAVLPGLFGAILAGLGGTILAFGGVGEAFRAGLDNLNGMGSASGAAANAVQRATVRVGDAQEDVARRIAEAQERAAEATEAANRRMTEAQERLRDVIFNNAQDLLSAQRGLRDAEENLADAQQRAIAAQQGLNAAREEARDRIRDLQFAVEEGAISEGEAVIALERARERLAQMNELPPNHRLRREAELQFAQAQLNLKRAKAENEDLSQEQEKSTKAGVEGSEEVLRVKQEQVDASRALRDAEEELGDARTDLARTELMNSRNIRDARQEIVDIERELVDIQRDLREEMAQANQGLARTLRDVGLSAGPGGAAGGIDKFGQSMSQLSPQAQSFVRFLLSVRDEFKAVREAAGVELFPKLEQAISRLISGGFLDVLSEGLQATGGAIGDVAIKIAELSADPFFQGNVRDILASSVTVIGNLGSALVNVSDLLVTITAAARPFTEEFSAWIAAFTGNWAEDARGNMDGIRDAIGRGVEVVKQFARIFDNLWTAIRNVGEIAAPVGQMLIDAFEQATASLAEFTGDDANREKFASYFERVGENVLAISSLVAALAREFIELGSNPAVATIAETLETRVVPAIATMFDQLIHSAPEMADAFASIAEMFTALAATGALEQFAETIGAFAEIVHTILDALGPRLVGFIGSVIGGFVALNLIMRALQFRSLIGNIGTVVGWFKKLGAASKLAGGFGLLIKNSKILTGIFKVLGVIFKPFVLLFRGLGAIIGKIISPITRIVAAIGMKGLMGIFLRFLGPVGLVITAVQLLWEGLKLLAEKTDWPWLDALVNGIQGAIDWISGAAGRIIEAITRPFVNAWNWLLDFLGINSPSRKFMELGAQIIAGLVGGIRGLWKNVTGFFGRAFGGLIGTFSRLPGRLSRAAGNIFGFMVSRIRSAIGEFREGGGGVKGWFFNLALSVLRLKAEIQRKASGLFNSIVEKVRAIIGKFQRGGGGVKGWLFDIAYSILTLKDRVARNASGLFNSLVSGIRKAIGSYTSGGGGIKGWLWSVVNFIKKDLPAKITNAGRNIWQGLSGGAVNVIGKVMQWVGKIPGINGTLELGGKTFKYARGGFYENHIAQIARGGANRIWAEPETGGEAYIPLAKAKRQRSKRILEIVAQKFGYNLAPNYKFADGGLWSSQPIKLPSWLKWIPGLKNLRVNSLFNSIIDKVASFFSGQSDGIGVDPGKMGSGRAMGIGAMTQAVKALDATARITSGLRRGARTATGFTSFHSLGRAIDIVSANKGRTWDRLKAQFGKTAQELYFSPRGFLRDGKFVNVSPVTKRTHYDHVHWAMAKGGTVAATPGGTDVTVGEGRRPETITPLRPDGLTEGEARIMTELNKAKNVTINVYAQPNQDINSLADAVSRRLAWEYR